MRKQKLVSKRPNLIKISYLGYHFKLLAVLAGIQWVNHLPDLRPEIIYLSARSIVLSPDPTGSRKHSVRLQSYLNLLNSLYPKIREVKYGTEERLTDDVDAAVQCGAV